MSIDLKTPEELQALSQQLRATLDAGLSKKGDLLERPQVVAQLFLRPGVEKYDLRDHHFEAAVSAYYAQEVLQWIPRYLSLHEALNKEGHTSRDNALEIGNDTYVWNCADRVSTPKSRPPAKHMSTNTLVEQA